MSTAAGAGPVIVGIDESAASKVAVDWAARDAARRGADLRLIHAVVPPAVSVFPEVPVLPDFLNWQQERGQELLDGALETARQAVGESKIEMTTDLVDGSPVAVLADMSRNADLVVVGCHDRGTLARGLLGSVSTGLVHHAHCPVAIIHDADPLMARPSQAPVVVGVDGSPASLRALEIAFEQASVRGVDLVAVHAWSDSKVFEFPGLDWVSMQSMAEETLSERLAGWQERYPDVAVRRVVVADRPAHQLLEQAEAAQLLVVGSHGRGGFAGMLLGSVSIAVVHGAKMPVIVARSTMPPASAGG